MDKAIASSPRRRITLPPTSDEEVTPPTVVQVEAMARVMPPIEPPHMVTHDLRHFFYACALIAGGASVKQARPRPRVRPHRAADLRAPVAG